MDGVLTTVAPRPRLLALLDSLAQRRLVCVIGDPSSGKTVAVRDWAARRPAVAWVAVAPGRDRPRHLLAALVDATEPFCPGLRDALTPELDAQATGAAPDRPLEPAAVLAGALAAGWADGATGTIDVVLDDVDAIADPAGVAFVAELVRVCPSSVRMTVLVRSVPPFAVHRLDAAGGYGEVGPRALRFDAAETTALFAGAGLQLDAQRAASITAACGGWAGGLRLAVESALEHGVDDAIGRLLTGTAPAYLAAVALEPLDHDTRGTVRALSVLGRLDRAATAARPAAAARLDALADRGLLVTADATGWALTALAGYAIAHAAPPDDAETRRILSDCVELALASGCAEDAVRWAARHGEPALVRRTLTLCGAQLLDSGSPVLGEAARRLPVPVGDVAIDGLLASHFAGYGDIVRALEHLGPVDGGGPSWSLPAGIAWRVANALWMHGEAGDAARVLDRVVDDGAAEPVDRAQLAASRATVAWGRGDGPAARRHADHALQAARAAGDEGALGVAWVTQALVAALEGDLVRNRRCYSTALAHARAARDVLTQLRVHCNVGSRLTETGRYRDAVAELDEALRLGEATGQRTRIALARLNQGQARLGLGLLDEALRDVDEALAVWTELDSPMASYAWQTRGDVLARRGDVSRAAQAYRAAIDAARVQQDAQTLAPALAGLARCVVGDDPDEAAALAAQARAQPAALGSVPALLASGWVALLRADRAAAAAFARSARTEAARRDDPSSLAQALMLEVLCAERADAADARLAEAGPLIDEVGDTIAAAELRAVACTLGGDRAGADRAQARLRALGVRDSAMLVAGPAAVLHRRRRASIRLRTLGSFGVELGDVAVPASAWQSRKARDLVKILAARRGKAVPRDTLADLLWPDSSDASGNRLSVALSTARAVFDPGKALPADHVLAADRDAVRLNLRTVGVDLEEYLAAADLALGAAADASPGAIGLLETAAAAYGGDFCEEDPFESWAAQTRDEVRARQQQVLRTLADLLVAAGRPDDAVPRLIALLGLDPYDEPTHLCLIGTLARVGRHGEARRSYRGYVERMAEIDVECAAFPQRAQRAG